MKLSDHERKPRHKPVPEPWSIDAETTVLQDTSCYVISGADGNVAALTLYDHDGFGEVEAHRIIACVNACAGVPTEALEGLAAELEARAAQRNDLQERLYVLIEVAETYLRTEAVLREAIQFAKGDKGEATK